MNEGIDLTGMACTGWLMGNVTMQPEIIVVGDWSLAEMYGMSPTQPSFRILQQHIRQGVESGDPKKMHLAFLMGRNSQTGAPGQPLTNFIIWTTEMWNSFCDKLGASVVRAQMSRGFMVGGLVYAFASFLNDADSGLLIRLQDIRLDRHDGLMIVNRMHDGPVPTPEVVAADLLKLVVHMWPNYRPENPGVFRVLQNGTLTEPERTALYAELWRIIQG